jgi:hypothetical protein
VIKTAEMHYIDTFTGVIMPPFEEEYIVCGGICNRK